MSARTVSEQIISDYYAGKYAPGGEFEAAGRDPRTMRNIRELLRERGLDAESLIRAAHARHVAKGANPAESVAQLADTLTSAGNADNLAHALVYLGYATERGAERLAAAVQGVGMSELHRIVTEISEGVAR